MPTPSSLTVSRTCRGYCVRVSGRGTMRESPALTAFARQILEEPGRPALDVDLAACDYLDSTFLGSLLGLLRSFKEPGATGRLNIAGPAEHLHRLLGPTHLDAILPLQDGRPESLGAELSLPLQAIDPDDLGRHVLECHRRLAELGDDNAAAFGPIVDQLARDLDKHSRACPA